MKRKRLSHRRSVKMFRKTSGIRVKNVKRSMRGGFRI